MNEPRTDPPPGTFDPLALREQTESSARPAEAVGLILRTADGGVR